MDGLRRGRRGAVDRVANVGEPAARRRFDARARVRAARVARRLAGRLGAQLFAGDRRARGGGRRDRDRARVRRPCALSRRRCLRTLPRIDSVRIDAGVLSMPSARRRRSRSFRECGRSRRSRNGACRCARSGGAQRRSLGGTFLRSTLVVVELAVTLVLVVLSGLTVRSFYVLTHPDLGVRYLAACWSVKRWPAEPRDTGSCRHA